MTHHAISRTVKPCHFGDQVTLTCSCGRWSAMTVSYGPYTVEHCTRSLLADRDGIHTATVFAGGVR